MNLRALIPNAFTMANLCCGMLAIVVLFTENYLYAAAPFLLLAAVFDLFDGFLARILKVAGPMGKQLDSLADAVTFGIAPSLMVLMLISKLSLRFDWSPYWSYFALLLAIASVYRLAKFNVDERQSERFLGLPTPANALFWVAVVALYYNGIRPGEPGDFILSGSSLEWTSVDEHFWNNRAQWLNYLFHPGMLIGLVLVMSYWMISDIPLLALKFKNISWKVNQHRYLLILLSFLSLLICSFSAAGVFLAVPIILLLYLIISIWDERSRPTHEIQG